MALKWDSSAPLNYSSSADILRLQQQSSEDLFNPITEQLKAKSQEALDMQKLAVSQDNAMASKAGAIANLANAEATMQETKWKMSPQYKAMQQAEIDAKLAVAENEKRKIDLETQRLARTQPIIDRIYGKFGIAPPQGATNFNQAITANNQAPVEPQFDRNNPATWGTRADGTPKGAGYLGLLDRPDGNVSTELSVGVNMDGKETQIPLIVPTLTADELNLVLNSDPNDTTTKLPESIYAKAADFARARIAEGLPVYAQEGEVFGLPEGFTPFTPTAPQNVTTNTTPLDNAASRYTGSYGDLAVLGNEDGVQEGAKSFYDEQNVNALLTEFNQSFGVVNASANKAEAIPELRDQMDRALLNGGITDKNNRARLIESAFAAKGLTLKTDAEYKAEDEKFKVTAAVNSGDLKQTAPLTKSQYTTTYGDKDGLDKFTARNNSAYDQAYASTQNVTFAPIDPNNPIAKDDTTVRTEFQRYKAFRASLANMGLDADSVKTLDAKYLANLPSSISKDQIASLKTAREADTKLARTRLTNLVNNNELTPAQIGNLIPTLQRDGGFESPEATYSFIESTFLPQVFNQVQKDILGYLVDRDKEPQSRFAKALNGEIPIKDIELELRDEIVRSSTLQGKVTQAMGELNLGKTQFDQGLDYLNKRLGVTREQERLEKELKLTKAEWEKETKAIAKAATNTLDKYASKNKTFTSGVKSDIDWTANEVQKRTGTSNDNQHILVDIFKQLNGRTEEDTIDASDDLAIGTLVDTNKVVDPSFADTNPAMWAKFQDNAKLLRDSNGDFTPEAFDIAAVIFGDKKSDQNYSFASADKEDYLPLVELLYEYKYNKQEAKLKKKTDAYYAILNASTPK